MYESVNGAPLWKPQWTVVNIHDCEDPSFDENSDDKVLIAILIALKHHSSSSNSSVRMKNPTNQQGGRPTAFQRLKYTAGTASYDRIFYFADIGTAGKCFVIITDTVSQTDQLLSHGRESASIGDIFAIVEPQNPTRALQDLPIVETVLPLIPLKQSVIPIREVNLVPPQIGQQRFFILIGKKIRVNRVNVMNASCQGLLCDRQKPFVRAASCGCIFTVNAAALVLMMNVKFEYEDENGAKASYTATNFRSWRTTTLFTKNITPSRDLVPFFHAQSEIRATVSEITRTINDGHGWTLIGWFRRGEVSDASSAANEAERDVAGINQPIHLAYLFPTSLDDVRQTEDRRFDAGTVVSLTSGANPSGGNEIGRILDP